MNLVHSSFLFLLLPSSISAANEQALRRRLENRPNQNIERNTNIHNNNNNRALVVTTTTSGGDGTTNNYNTDHNTSPAASGGSDLANDLMEILKQKKQQQQQNQTTTAACECGEHQYCSSGGVCQENGSCIINDDCLITENLYPLERCGGTIFCDVNFTCDIRCGLPPKEEEEPAVVTSYHNKNLQITCATECDGEEEYCGSTGECMTHGSCEIVDDCSNSQNIYALERCHGDLYCQANTCGITCGPPTTKLANDHDTESLATSTELQQQQQQVAAAATDSTLTTTTTMAAANNNKHEDVKNALQAYFDSLQVVLGFEPTPTDTSELQQKMEPLVKEVKWALNVMHPGMDKTLVTDDVILKHLRVIGKNSHKQQDNNDNNNNERQRKLAHAHMDSEQCLEQTRDILAISMRVAYYELYGDLLQTDDIQVQDAGQSIAQELDIVEVRERLRKLGPLEKSEDDYKLIAKEAFRYAETEIGLNGILSHGMKEWSSDMFWATGFLASQLWASAIHVGVYDMLPISSQTFYNNPDNNLELQGDTISHEFAKLVDNYNTHCLTCPTGDHWTDNGLSDYGLHCTTGWSPNCDENCLQAQCGAAQGKWADVDLEMNPYTCYIKTCPPGWTNKGIQHNTDDNSALSSSLGMLCTMSRRDNGSACNEDCAQTQCSKVGGAFPLNIDDVADNPYVCYVN